VGEGGNQIHLVRSGNHWDATEPATIDPSTLFSTSTSQPPRACFLDLKLTVL
jgi:hypothetical protein